MKKLQDTEYTGTLPATLQTVAGYLAGYKVWGNTGGVGNEAIVANLPEPLCGIDTYSDVLELSTGTLTRRIRKFELTGEENITLYTIATGNLFRTELPTLRVLGQFAGAGVCTHYRIVTSATDRVNGTISGGGTAGVQKFVDIVDGYATADDFKSFLAAQYAAGTPVTIWYVLAEPEISTVTVPTGLTGTIEGYLIQDGTPTPEAPIYPSANGIRNADDTYSIQYGYKLPILSNDTTTDIFIGNTQLAKDEYVDSETGKIYRYVDGTLTPTDPPVPLPQIPTFAGETIVDYGIAALPHAAGLDGIFEYGNIDGLTWKNSVSGENDITFDTAATDTGAEYILPAGASGQYTSKSGEYRTAFTWYCVAKCPTTCHSAGQYMISDLGNGIGVEISSGWTAYSSVGGNHLVRGVDNRDFNSAEAVTNYALIAVSGDVNGMASIYVNGEKMTDSWNFNPVPSDRADTIFLGKRASGQLSGTDIDYKFLAFGTVKQTDTEIAANSQYLMTKYLGVGRPEKVELDVHGWTNTLYSIYHQGKWINSAEKKRVNGKWIPASSWSKFRELVRSGDAPTLYPVGTKLYENWGDTTSNAWIIVDYPTGEDYLDSDLAQQGYTNRVMLMEEKLNYLRQFDAIEAWLYVETTIPAGTYRFTIPNYDASHGGNKTYIFTSTANVPVGGQLTLTWNYQQNPSAVQAYSSATSTSALFNVSITEWDGTTVCTDLGTIKLAQNDADSTYGKLNHIQRARYGSNNYYQSGYRQWLNTNASANWWTPTNIFDRPYGNRTNAGRLNVMNSNMESVLATPTVNCITNNQFEYPSLDGTTFSLQTAYTVKDKLFPVTHSEINLSSSPNVNSVLDYYVGKGNADRIKYRKDNGDVYYWWLRTPYPTVARSVRTVDTSGALGNVYAYVTSGSAAVCIIQ